MCVCGGGMIVDMVYHNILSAFNMYVIACRFCANSSTVAYVDNLLEFNKPGIGTTLLYMFVEGVVFFILTLIVQVN